MELLETLGLVTGERDGDLPQHAAGERELLAFRTIFFGENEGVVDEELGKCCKEAPVGESSRGTDTGDITCLGLRSVSVLSDWPSVAVVLSCDGRTASAEVNGNSGGVSIVVAISMSVLEGSDVTGAPCDGCCNPSFNNVVVLPSIVALLKSVVGILACIALR